MLAGAIAVAAVTLISGSCGMNDIHEVRGVLVDVQSHEIQNADTITLRDDHGTLQTFRVSPEVANNSDHPNSAAHLRQHMMLGDPVIIRYRLTEEEPSAIRTPVALRILDVPAT
jgi:hypothetical protein